MRTSRIFLCVLLHSWFCLFLPAAERSTTGKSIDQRPSSTSEAGTHPPIPLEVEILSQTVSKLQRDSFGNTVNPFQSFSMDEGESGVMILSKITQRNSNPMKLSPEKCRLVSFKDDT